MRRGEGFTGNLRWLIYRDGDYEAAFSVQKSRYSTKDERPGIPPAKRLTAHD
jgi:hypothetical protein